GRGWRVQKRKLQALLHQTLSGQQLRAAQVEVFDPVVPSRIQAVQDKSHRCRQGIGPSKYKDHTATRGGTVKLECHPYVVLQAETRQRIEIAVQQIVLYTHEFLVHPAEQGPVFLARRASVDA